MKIKRVFASLATEFDKLVSKIENHEVAAECAIAEVRQQAARIHTQNKQAKDRLSRLKSRQAQLENKCEQWKQRAIACGPEDREKGLRCVQAMQNTESELQHVHEQIIEAERLGSELQAHLTESEKKLAELQSRKESLTARSARNRIMRTASDEPAVTDTDAVFSRWEQTVVADEYISPGSSDPDADLDREFLSEEDKEELELELDALLSGSQQPEEGEG